MGNTHGILYPMDELPMIESWPLETFVWLFLGAFVLHELEEILFLIPWLRTHRSELQSRFPRLAKPFVRLSGLSARAFSIAVCEEFALLGLVSIIALLSGWYGLWFGVFVAFVLHLCGHVLQALVWRGYIPALATSLILLPGCIYLVIRIGQQAILSFPEMILWSWVGIGVVAINLHGAHRLADRIDRKGTSR